MICLVIQIRTSLFWTKNFIWKLVKVYKYQPLEMILILLASFQGMSVSRNLCIFRVNDNCCLFCFHWHGKHEVMGQVSPFFFQRKRLIWMPLGCEDSVKLVFSEGNQFVFLVLVYIPWIESLECIGFSHVETAKSEFIKFKCFESLTT